MSTLYDALARTKQDKNLSQLMEPSTPPKYDPILGEPPKIVSRWNTFQRKHGTLIEKVMTDVIQNAPGWQPQGQTHFNFGDKTAKHLIDRIAINRTNKVVVFIECKRNLGNVDSKGQKKIRDYDEWCYEHKEGIAAKLGFPVGNALVRFAVFNAYGEETDVNMFQGIPVLRPIDLCKIFDVSVYGAFVDLQAEVSKQISENEQLQDCLQEPKLRSVESLKQEASQPNHNEDPESFQRRINYTLDQLMRPKG